MVWAILVGSAALVVLAAGFIGAIIYSQRRHIRSQKMRLEELREREAKYRNLFENSLIGMFRVSLNDWKILEVNESLRKILAPVSLPSDPGFLSYFNPDDQASLKEHLYDHGSVQNYETFLKRTDGTYLWISFSARVFFKDGYVEGVVSDITDRKLAEEKIREQAMLLEQAPDAIIVLDLENRVKFWNPGAEKLYQWTAAEAMGQSIAGIIYDPKELPFFELRRKDLMKKGEWTGELRQRKKDLAKITTTSRWTLVRGVDGLPKSILEIHTDVTEKKILEDKFLRSQRIESLGILAGGIAHDLNNILAPITMSIGMLKAKWLDVVSHRHLSTLERSAERAADIVKQVLTFARGIEGDRTAIRPETVIGEVAKIVSETFPKSIELETALRADLWTIMGDATQLQQVLMNLCINARDAMPRGGRLSLTAENTVVDEQFAATTVDAHPGVYVVITVTDTGSGIPPSQLEKIFEPFFTTKTLGRGTGLGLSTTLGIVKSHRGFILVDSTVDAGSTFSVYLPAQLQSIPVPTVDSESPLKRGNGELILVVDDEEPILDFAKSILEDQGYTVLTATDGVEAIALCASKKNDVKAILTDIMMPHLDGLGMIHSLHETKPDIPILAMTGLTTTEERRVWEKEGVVGILQKPFTSARVLSLLEALLHPGTSNRERLQR